jgi:steroid delta-isomerase-like uncharacterized protein
MSVEENVALMKRFFKEVWNEGNTQTIYHLLDENVVATGQDQPGIEIHGPGDFVALYHRLRGAFPDIRITVEDGFGALDKVAIRWSAVMTHTGEYLGIPATKKNVRISGITIAQIKNGKVVRGWDNWDQLALMQQLSAAAASTARTA